MLTANNSGVYMDNTDLIKKWESEENHAFLGWDFSHINGRFSEPDPPWNYKTIVQSYLKDTDILLDMGTGGGEVLLSFNHPYKNTYATEAYEPNYELCKKTLSPLGITVARTFTDEDFNSDDKIPFGDEMFDIIINRHESFDINEVNRTLKQGGYFITQQVGNKNAGEFIQRLNENIKVPRLPHHTVDNYTNGLKNMGFRIIKTDEFQSPMKFYDVEAFVFWAKVIVWEFPGFSVKTHLDKLFDCQKEIDEKGFIQGTGHYFLIIAKKMQ
jgi:SAM-dependent methyltransferase